MDVLLRSVYIVMCWTLVLNKEIGHVCYPPDNTVQWHDDPHMLTVTVEWGYVNLTCHTVQSCFRYSDRHDEFIEPQLVPIEIQKGAKLEFAPTMYDDIYFPILPYKVDERAFKSCNLSAGVPVIEQETNETFTIKEQFLTIGNNYFIVESDADTLIRCEFGLRLNVTVKENGCHRTHGDSACRGQGFCVTKTGQAKYTCSCCGNFKGEYCEEYDSCLEDPCQNGGHCEHNSDDKRGFECSCMLGYTGILCEERVPNLCDLNLCENNSSCRGNFTHFMCKCPPGFTGSHCEVDINDCAGSPCQNGGICVDRVNHFDCFCVPGFHGELCQKKFDECKYNPCLHHGACENQVDSYRCHCQPGFTGRNCEEKILLCKNNPCFNQSACLDYGTRYQCRCNPGYAGHHCEININDCLPNPCMNGGSCHDRVGGYQCLCHEMHAGPNCQYTLDMFAPFLEGKPRGVTPLQHSYHVRNLYIVAGTLSGAIFIVIIVLTGCYCRMHESYKKFNFKRLKYKRHTDEDPGESAVDVSSVARPPLSIDAIWEATSLSCDSDTLPPPVQKDALKHMKI